MIGRPTQLFHKPITRTAGSSGRGRCLVAKQLAGNYGIRWKRETANNFGSGVDRDRGGSKLSYSAHVLMWSRNRLIMHSGIVSSKREPNFLRFSPCKTKLVVCAQNIALLAFPVEHNRFVIGSRFVVVDLHRHRILVGRNIELPQRTDVAGRSVFFASVQRSAVEPNRHL